LDEESNEEGHYSSSRQLPVRVRFWLCDIL
jgi:hypothetical protein